MTKSSELTSVLFIDVKNIDFQIKKNIKNMFFSPLKNIKNMHKNIKTTGVIKLKWI